MLLYFEKWVFRKLWWDKIGFLFSCSIFWLSFFGWSRGCTSMTGGGTKGQEQKGAKGQKHFRLGLPAAPICTVVAGYLSVCTGIILKIIKPKHVKREGERQSYLLIFLWCMHLMLREAGAPGVVDWIPRKVLVHHIYYLHFFFHNQYNPAVRESEKPFG